MTKHRKVSPWMGLVSFAICITLLILARTFLPAELGLYFTAIVEGMLLLLALASALLTRTPLKAVFPIKKPRWNHLLGLAVLYYGGIYAVSVITYLTGFLFPEQMLATMDGMNAYMDSVPFLLGFIIVAVLPPLCEESLHRGFIMYSFSSMKNTAWKLILMGIIFGVFHLELYRFFITAASGVLLAYLMHETENLLIPMLYHFVNNAISFFSSGMQSTPLISDTSMLFSPFLVGFVLCANGVAAPFLLYGGSRLLTRKGCRSSEKPFPHKKFLTIAGIIAGCCLISGMVLMILGAKDFFSETILPQI